MTGLNPTAPPGGIAVMSRGSANGSDPESSAGKVRGPDVDTALTPTRGPLPQAQHVVPPEPKDPAGSVGRPEGSCGTEAQTPVGHAVASAPTVFCTLETDLLHALLHCLNMPQYLPHLALLGYEGRPGLLRLLTILDDCHQVRELLPPRATGHQRLSLATFWKDARRLGAGDPSQPAGKRLEGAVQAMVWEGLFVRNEGVEKDDLHVVPGECAAEFQLRVNCPFPPDERAVEAFRQALGRLPGADVTLLIMESGPHSGSSALRCICRLTDDWDLPASVRDLITSAGTPIGTFETLPPPESVLADPSSGVHGYRIAFGGTEPAREMAICAS